MATAAQDAARVKAILIKEDRALERDTRNAQAGVRRAAAQAARQERAAGGGGGGGISPGRILRNAWRRPPRPGLRLGLGRLFRAPRGRPARKGSDGKRFVSVHFAVSQSSSREGS